MTMTDRTPTPLRWYALSADEVVDDLGTDPDQGLSPDEVQRRIAEYGANVIPAEPPPTPWQMAKGQLANPMNVMLLVVSVASFVIGQFATGAVVGALVLLNVVMGTNQERKAMASVEALAELQVPTARVRRSDRVEEVDASGLVPGDILLLEAGDIVPADAAGGFTHRRERMKAARPADRCAQPN